VPKTVLITGASAGIGKELARCFARDGYRIVMAARDPEKLRAAAAEIAADHGVQTIPIDIDLAVPDAARTLHDRIEQQGITIDVLVNNAGFANFGKFVNVDLERETRLIHLNIVAVAQLTWLYARKFVERDEGRILNVASTAAFVSGPWMANYFASKAYVLSLTEAVACELRHSKVTITALCTGPVRTEFFDRAGMAGTRIAQGKVAGIMTPQAVAAAAYRGMMKGRTLIVPGMLAKLGAFVPRFMPRRVMARLAGNYNRQDT